MSILRNLSLVSFLSISLALCAQDYCMTSPVGFGAQTTGGEGGDIITVGTRDELKAALKKSEPAIIIVTQNITFGENQNISVDPKDKTILGLPGVKLISTARASNGGILGFGKGSSNIIIRNLIFEGPGAFDVDGRDLLTNTGCVNLWVDHCEFYDGVDDNFDNTNYADNISISWCKFGYRIPAKTEGMTGDGSGEHRFSNLIGGSSSDKPADGRYSVTFQYCYWADSCAQRMPRARNAELHLLNCYYNTSAPNSLAIGLGAGTNGTTCYVEGCDFKKVAQVVRNDYDKVAGKEAAVKFAGCLGGGNDSGTATAPAYTYPVLDVEQLEHVITSPCGAGATLEVTTTGEISSPCTGQDPLFPPRNVAATATANSITLTWEEVENVTGYRVQLCHEEVSETGSEKTWDFSTWSINAENADAHLGLDGNNNGRFNYLPATNAEELTFANGTAIPDLAGLRFTAGSSSKLRLGFATGMLYLNGSGIKVAISCSPGDRLTVEGIQGNATATDRGFSVSGATVDTEATSPDITGGIMTLPNTKGTWAYTAETGQVELTTIGGGMNLFNITVHTDESTTTVCDEQDVPGNQTYATFNGLDEGMTYTYQVKAIKGEEESAYSNPQSIVTANPSATDIKSDHRTCNFYTHDGCLYFTDCPVTHLSIFDLAGRPVATFRQTPADISSLEKGIYLIEASCIDDTRLTGKVVVR